MASALLLSADPSVNGIFVESPDPPDPDGRDFAFSRILADCNLVQFQIFCDFLCGHNFWHGTLLYVWIYLIGFPLCETMSGDLLIVSLIPYNLKVNKKHVNNE